MLNKKGFTLPEILTTLGILLIIIFISSDFIVNGFKSLRFEQEQEVAVKTARIAMEDLKREIRGANMSESGDYPLLVIEDDDFIFFTDVDDDYEFEKVRYRMIGTILEKSVYEPGPSNDYSTIGATMTIANYMNNDEEAVFLYFDSDYNETALINDVRLIQISLKINVTPTISPNDYYVTTDVNLRNLKDNL